MTIKPEQSILLIIPKSMDSSLPSRFLECITFFFSVYYSDSNFYHFRSFSNIHSSSPMSRSFSAYLSYFSAYLLSLAVSFVLAVSFLQLTIFLALLLNYILNLVSFLIFSFYQKEWFKHSSNLFYSFIVVCIYICSDNSLFCFFMFIYVKGFSNIRYTTIVWYTFY